MFNLSLTKVTGNTLTIRPTYIYERKKVKVPLTEPKAQRGVEV
jgi:hypothetical protein